MLTSGKHMEKEPLERLEMKIPSAPSKNKERLKIFVSAYACEPHLGSEIGVGWHWVLEMSKYFELWVLTRESNRHTIEPWIDKHPAYKKLRKIIQLTY